MTVKAPASNIQEYTVSDLSGALKRVVEDQFSLVRLRGEISGYRGPHSSGHVYFSLKDQNARIDAVIWKGVFGKMRVRPEEGLEVIATGKVTTFPGKSAYQIVVEALEPAGAGALMALLDERRRKLAAEGLFAPERKRALPFLPRVIGVITSPTGAVIRDILHRIAERFPMQVLVWPVRVQGETSGAEVAAAIAGFNQLGHGGAIPKPDVLIVARGGGSLEDLWSFNEEAVVRAAAESRIPLIAAVGHETDWTLIDHAADRRAPTPTAAAEFAAPVLAELQASVSDLRRRQLGAGMRLLERRRSDLRGLARALPASETFLAALQQRVDMGAGRLAGGRRAMLDLRAIRVSRLAARLAQRSPQASLARDAARLASARQRLCNQQTRFLERKSDRLRQTLSRFANVRQAHIARLRKAVDARRDRCAALAARLGAVFMFGLTRRRDALEAADKLRQSLGYTSILARGFALVRDAAGRPLRLAAAARCAVRLDIEFSDGRVGAVAAPPSAAGRGQKDQNAPLKQASLF